VPAVTNYTLTVTLSGQAAPAGDLKALDRLRRQLQWSLLSDQGPQRLELKIKGQDAMRYSDQDYLVSNLAGRLVGNPQRFAVLNGVIRRIVKSPQAGDPIPALRPEDNKNIAAAAMSTSTTSTFVAAVTAGKTGKLRVGSAGPGAQATLHDVGHLSGTFGDLSCIYGSCGVRAVASLLVGNAIPNLAFILFIMCGGGSGIILITDKHPTGSHVSTTDGDGDLAI